MSSPIRTRTGVHNKSEAYTMAGEELNKTRDLACIDMLRGKVGWAHYRARKKQATHQYRRRVEDRQVIAESYKD